MKTLWPPESCWKVIIPLFLKCSSMGTCWLNFNPSTDIWRTQPVTRLIRPNCARVFGKLETNRGLRSPDLGKCKFTQPQPYKHVSPARPKSSQLNWDKLSGPCKGQCRVSQPSKLGYWARSIRKLFQTPELFPDCPCPLWCGSGRLSTDLGPSGQSLNHGKWVNHSPCSHHDHYRVKEESIDKEKVELKGITENHNF